ncbi:hypothetical protein HMPREF3293_01783 [Christensenella minuta]|uniref:Uncharacterized protein n=1 Tax=Christensenella minuta TaxID=626937 RepID=A0A136Q4I6_9FIRM|nr:hypothetical protein [Christensenella minuta]KXK65569.1 hypothetical protein HMPREF3293_01783 [Christensenella minuta]
MVKYYGEGRAFCPPGQGMPLSAQASGLHGRRKIVIKENVFYDR